MQQELDKEKSPSSLGQLEKAFKRTWAKISPQSLKNLVASMPARVSLLSSFVENTLTAEMKLLCEFYGREGMISKVSKLLPHPIV